VDDVQTDPDQDPAVWAAIDTRAFVSVPLIRDGRFRASLFVNHRQPRAWSRADLCLIEDVAARTWDAHELARAEASLRALNAALEQEVESRNRELDRVWRLSPVLMVVAGPDGRLLQANPAWTRNLGWSVEQTIGQDVMQFVAPEDRETGAAGMQRLFEGQPVIEYQNTFVTSRGDRRRIAWTSVPEDGKLYGFGRDITEQMLVEQRLRQAQKMEAVGQLTGGVAHDFNNLLTGIIGSLDLLQSRIAQGRTQEISRYVELAQSSARRAAALTQRLLAFSRQQTLHARAIDVNLLVAGMEELIRRTVGPELDVVVTTAPGLWPTLVDAHQLENALLNLCINARDAMPDGGRLGIVTANHRLDAAAAQQRDLPPGAYVGLAVSDTGTGMTPDVRQRAFDPFFTTKPPGAGTGLGLSMIYGFARQSGGQTCIDTAPGNGTTVTIFLPRHHGAPAGAATETTRDSQAASPGGTVLVVDDELTIRLLIAEVLEEHGFRTLQAADAAAGLEALHTAGPIDLLVTDVGLSGGQNGRQFARAARARYPALPVVFVTGYAEKAVLDHERLEPGMRILPKPFALDQLVDCVRRLLSDG
jgi:PAS domain S-box-containing protein